MKDAKKVRIIIQILFCYFVAIFISSKSFAEQISGYVTTCAGNLVLVSEDQQTKTPIRAFNTQSATDLARLSFGDFLTATGEYSDSTFVVTNVDFVGLKQLIGVWLAGSNVVNFSSFTNVTARTLISKRKNAVDLTYSLSPGETDSWRIFFSDNDNILLGTLTLKKNTAALQFIDSDTGELSKVIELKKIQGYQ